MKKIVFITPEDAEFGFDLTGADQLLADEENMISLLKNIIVKPETGLVIIDERLINSENEEKMREAERAWSGVLVVLPSPERQEAVIEDYASRLIRRAVGYHVRLKI
jgi:V/A-type H+-transporting ATPase subunit F